MGCPLASLLLVTSRRFVGGCRLAGHELRGQEKVLDSAIRRPEYERRATLLAGAGWTAAIGQLRGCDFFAGFALKVGLPGLKAVGGREVDAFTLQAPDVIGKPEKVISAGREVGDGDQFGHRLIR